MSATAYWVRLGGTTPVTELAPHTAPTWETWADGGNGAASFEVGRSAKFEPHLLRPGTLCEVMLGCQRVHLGRIDDYDRIEGAVSVRGIHTDALGIPALDGGGNLTKNAATAATTAKAAPWSWVMNDPDGMATAMGDADGDSTEPLTVAALYDLCAQQVGYRWGQRADGSLYFRADPTAASWLIAPDVAAFGPTTEGQASHLVGRYFDGTNNATIIRSDPDATVVRAETVDLTSRGTLTSPEATAILDAALAAGKSRTSWVNGINLNREQLATIGGGKSHLAAVTAGSMVRALGLAAVHAGVQSAWLDVVIGKTRYTAGTDTIYLEPVSTAPRTFADVIAAA